MMLEYFGGEWGKGYLSNAIHRFVNAIMFVVFLIQNMLQLVISEMLVYVYTVHYIYS